MYGIEYYSNKQKKVVSGFETIPDATKFAQTNNIPSGWRVIIQ